jgi:hypothetical protein
MGQIRKIQKHKEERDRSGKFKKTRRKEWRKEKEEIITYIEVPILMCSPSVEKHPRATLPEENALIWEPPLQHLMHEMLNLDSVTLF